MSKKRGIIIAPHDSVILRQLDDNEYDQKDIEVKEGGLARDVEQITHGYEYKGVVVAVGNKVQSDVKIGDIVHHGLHSTSVVSFNGENLAKLPEYQFSLIERLEEEPEM